MSTPHVHDADIAILGSGASGTHGLLRTVELLGNRESPLEGTFRIVVIERDSQFNSGIPYGHRSGRSSLLISALSDFLPDEERRSFVAWLNERREEMLSWATDGVAPDSSLAAAMDRDWILRHEDDIRACRWEGLYLPRRLYGQYLAQQVEQTLAAAQRIVDVVFVHADINEVTVAADDSVRLRELSATGEVRFEVRALSALMAVGSPPVRQLSTSDENVRSVNDHFEAGLIPDIHTPEIEYVLERIRLRLEALPIEKREILLVGGNADALEFLIASHRMRQDTGARLSILSSLGRPHYWHHDRPGEEASLPAVSRLLRSAESGVPLRARDLYSAVRSELASAIDNGNVNSTVTALIGSVGSALAHMDDYELCSMATEHGVAISNLLRRTGGDSLDFLDAGISDGTITCIPGRFRIAHHRDGMLSAVVDSSTASPGRDAVNSRTHPQNDFAVIVNATGFEQATDTRSPLLRQMLGSSVVRASASRTGIALDGSFRAAPGVFVLGPLMAGYHHGSAAYWHIESVARIIQLSGQVAECLVTDTLSRRSVPDLAVTV